MRTLVVALGKYPWSSWFAKSRIEIVRGVDYTISQSTMHQSIRNAASRAGVSVRLQETGGSIIIEVVGRPISEVLHSTPIAVPDERPVALD